MKIGVYICYCGSNIAATVDVEEVAEYARRLEGVVVARTNKYTCSDPGQETIRQDIVELGLDRVVVGACSPRMHERTFRAALQKAGLNPYFLEVANIREHCSWVHSDIPLATEKAKDLIRAAVERVWQHRPLYPRQEPVTQAALVVGGGIAGIQAALDIGNAGFPVYLVERQPSIGGHMAQLDKTFPTLDCSACILTPKMVDVSAHPNIHLMTYSEVADVKGYVGNFQVSVKHKPRYVDVEKCTGCGDCREVCPVIIPARSNLYEQGLIDRRAAYRSFPQAVPNAFVVDKLGISPCRDACPTGQRAQGYISLIREGRYKDAMRVIKEDNPFPGICGRICNHRCEDACNRALVDEPVDIRALKRFVTDKVYAEPRVPLEPCDVKYDKQVAIIGAGPCGLTAAQDLVRLGYPVTVFEALPVAGGMLRVGVPAYRLPTEIIEREIADIVDLGVDLRLNHPVENLNDLFEQGYDAVLIAVGAHEGIRLPIPGAHLDGVLINTRLLRDVRLGNPPELGEKVVVVGAGDVAMDVARTAVRLGSEVHIHYRRSRAEATGDEEEIRHAGEEGVVFNFLSNPIEVVSDGNGTVVGVRCVRMELGEPDASGRPRPLPIPGSEYLVPCDNIIFSVGQRAGLAFIPADAGVELTRDDRIVVDPDTLATTRPSVFAGGDAVRGTAFVIDSVASGHTAAESIHRYLQGESLERPPMPELPVVHLTAEEVDDLERRGEVELTPRQGVPEMEVDKRLRSFHEVSRGYTDELAQAEAARCLACGYCSECLSCWYACEPGAINHDMEEQVEEIDVGTIILATGFEMYDAHMMPQYGYGRLENVYTALEVERLTNAGGPTSGAIRLKDGREPQSVAILHCIGSRDRQHNAYCSRVCCMYSMKLAHLIREKTHAEVYEFYFDITAYGKGYTEFYDRVQEEGVIFIRGKGAQVEGTEGGRLLVRAEETLLGEIVEIPVDMVVLATAMVPATDAEEVAQLFHITRGEDGFFLEAHPKLRPVETATEGIFLAGTCQAPKDIPDTVAQASGAAAQALGLLQRGSVEIEPITAEVLSLRCVACGLCVEVCPFGSIEMIEQRGQPVAEINPALCKGCGVCVAACRGRAMTLHGYSDQQLLLQLGALLRPAEMVVR